MIFKYTSCFLKDRIFGKFKSVLKENTLQIFCYEKINGPAHSPRASFVFEFICGLTDFLFIEKIVDSTNSNHEIDSLFVCLKNGTVNQIPIFQNDAFFDANSVSKITQIKIENFNWR